MRSPLISRSSSAVTVGSWYGVSWTRASQTKLKTPIATNEIRQPRSQHEKPDDRAADGAAELRTRIGDADGTGRLMARNQLLTFLKAHNVDSGATGAAIFPLVPYALFGSSRQLILGPDAATCIMVAASLAPLAQGDPRVT